MKLKYNDNVHGYWLDGKRCKGVSSVAKILDDTWDLDLWRKRMVAQGVAENPDLQAQILLAVKEGDKGLLNECAEEAVDRAGANAPAVEGTRQHTVTEKHDRGEAHDDPMTADRWASILDKAGLIPVTEFIERTVVWPEQGIAGRFDRLAMRKTDGLYVPVDLKTGASAVRYPHASVIQLALYGNAPLLAGTMEEYEPGKFVTERFTDMRTIDMDRDEGYLVHLPLDGEAGVYALNLKLGLKAAQDIVFPALRWRAMKHDRIIRKVV